MKIIARTGLIRSGIGRCSDVTAICGIDRPQHVRGVRHLLDYVAVGNRPLASRALNAIGAVDAVELDIVISNRGPAVADFEDNPRTSSAIRIHI